MFPSFPRELSTEAKAKGIGVMMMAYRTATKVKVVDRATMSPKQFMFFKWAMAILFCDEVKELPDLEGVVKKLMQQAEVEV